MKKIFTVLVCILTTVAFLSPAWAIDRSPKNKSSEGKEKPAEFKETKKRESEKVTHKTGTFSEKIIRKGETTEKDAPKKSEKTKGWSGEKKSKERYDYFIDRNNNGIDDRLEKDTKAKNVKKRKAIEKKTPVPLEKAPTKVSPSTKTPKKVKEIKASEQKKETKVKNIEKKKGKEKR
jgi:hypothetical protein